MAIVLTSFRGLSVLRDGKVGYREDVERIIFSRSLRWLMTDTCIPVSGHSTRGLVRVMLSCHSEAHGRGTRAKKHLENYKCKNSAVTHIRGRGSTHRRGEGAGS